MKLSYLFDTDSYKASHYLQYPPGTTSLYSYVESRGGKFKETLFFGLQYFLKEYMNHRVTPHEVEFAKDFYAKHGVTFNYEGWMYVATELQGKLPVKIKAVPEGTVVPTGNILLSIESTDEKAFWVVSWLETMLLRYIWYPTTVATNSYMIKKIIMQALEESSDKPQEEIMFKLHDFGSRGVSSQESAMIGGAAHLVNFMGSDTIAGIICANEYYNCPMAGFSIPAAEHSSITSWGKENEVEAYRNMLAQFAKPGSLVAVVSDSYDIYNACDNLWGKQLKQEVIDSGATVVIRPDSGNPPEIVLSVVSILDKNFGSTINSKGYKVLNNVRVIQGDGINDVSIKEILKVLLDAGYSATNVAFGMGGALLQSVNRDTQSFAMKCSHITIGDRHVNVFKDPVTDSGKKSKSGRLDLAKINGEFATVPQSEANESLLETVYENGEILCNETFENIRARANNS
jgi:nicotinamide phosphoribosyltransferase